MKLSLLFVSFHKITNIIVISIFVVVVMLYCFCVIFPVFSLFLQKVLVNVSLLWLIMCIIKRVLDVYHF